MSQRSSVHSRKAALFAALLIVSPFFLSGCTLEDFIPEKGKTTDVQDRQQHLSREDFDALNDRSKLIPDDAKVDAKLGAPPIPDVAQVLASPRPPKVANTKLVTLAVTEDVPLRDVMFELGRLANVDIEVGAGLDNYGINLRATDRPFNEVIERIAELGNLRYSVQGNAIHVEKDTPYIKNYPLDFLNMVRSSTSNYTLSTSILSSGSSTGSGGTSGSSGGSSTSTSSGSNGSSSGISTTGVGTSGSSSSITAQSDSDLWSSLEASITEILNYNPVVSNASEGTSASSGGGSVSGSGSTGTMGSKMPGSSGGGTGTSGALPAGNFVINRQAGVLSVNATQRQHEMIQQFLALISRNASAQVLIEAKIVEVSLSNQFLSGINWNDVIGTLGKNYVTLGQYSPGTTNELTQTAGTTGNAITLGLKQGSLDAVLTATERYGTTRTLSSPRLSAINNQQAVLTFAQNTVFFTCTATPGTTTSTSGGSTSIPTSASVDCTPNTVPIGILLNILPSINLDTQEITLNVRPTLTRHLDDVTSPETQYIQALLAQTCNASGGSNPDCDIPVTPITVPEIEVREIDSVMKVKSGGVMVIGGLMEDNTTSTQVGVPGAKDIPIFGNLFKSRNEDSGKRELVILIKATIVNSDGSTDPVDRAVYKKYFTDPRNPFPDASKESQ